MPGERGKARVLLATGDDTLSGKVRDITSSRVAIQVAGPCGFAYATYGNLAVGDCRTFALLPAKISWLRQGVHDKNQPLAIQPCVERSSSGGRRDTSMRLMKVGLLGTIGIHGEEYPPCNLMLGWPSSTAQDMLTTPWVSRVASDLASELAELLPAAIAELADEWAMLGYQASSGWVPSSYSLHIEKGDGDDNNASPSGTSTAGGTSTAPFWNDKEAGGTAKAIKLSPSAPPCQGLRLCMGGLKFRDPVAERDYNIFSGANQALTDFLTLLVGAVLCASCVITSESSAAQAAWYQANRPYGGDIYCVIGIAYVPLLLPAVLARASWYLQNRQTILLIRVALMFLLSGALIVPHTEEPDSLLVSTICINTLVSLPLIHGLEAFGSRVPVILSLPLRLAILCLSIPAVPAACKHDTKGSWLFLPCTTLGALCHVILLGIAPLAMHAWIERRERHQFVEARQQAR